MTDRPRPIFPYLLIIFVCNLADWALTLDAVNGGWATELNPVASWTFDQGNTASFIVKMVMVLPGLLLLWLMRRRLWARALAVALAWIYVILVGYHAYGRLVGIG